MYIEGDIFDIASRVKDIDPALSLSLDHRRGEYELKRNDTHVMFIQPGELDYRILVKLRKNDLARRRLQDFILEMERSEDEFEEKKIKELRSYIEDVTLDNFDRMVGIPHFTLGGI